MKYHITKAGRKIKLSELELNHLINIINFIKRKAKEGLMQMICGMMKIFIMVTK